MKAVNYRQQIKEIYMNPSGGYGAFDEGQNKPTFDKSKIENIEFTDIDWKDYPDFCDAYIISAEIDGRSLTQNELDIINDDRDFLYEKLIEYLF